MALQLPKLFIDLQVPLLYLTNILGLALGPKHQVLRIGLTLPAYGLLVTQSLYREWNGTWGMQYANECLVLSLVFMYVDWNLLGSPDKERWHKVVDPSESDVVPQGFWERVWWAVRLSTGNRFVGWSHEVKNVPKEVGADYSRVVFVARKALRVLMFYVMRDAFYAYTAASPYGSYEDIVHLKPVTSLEGQPFWTRWWWAWVNVVLSYAAIEQANAAYGAMAVATGLATPRNCPSVFGDLKELVTLRKAWSFVWHQCCRRLCSAPGIFLARDVLRLPKGSFASKYLQLFVGFGISGIVHGCAVMFVHRSLDDNAAIAYFVGQAAIIMVEDHVIDLGKRLGFKDSALWRFVGFAWTVFIIGATSQVWNNKQIGDGIWVHDRTIDFFGIGPSIVP